MALTKRRQSRGVRKSRRIKTSKKSRRAGKGRKSRRRVRNGRRMKGGQPSYSSAAHARLAMAQQEHKQRQAELSEITENLDNAYYHNLQNTHTDPRFPSSQNRLNMRAYRPNPNKK